jgi:hypothetical protein
MNSTQVLSIKDSIREGWNITKRDWANLLALGIISLVISVVILTVLTVIFGHENVLNANEANDTQNLLSNLIYMLISSVFSVNLIKIMINAVRGEKINVLKMFTVNKQILNLALKYSLASIIYAIMVAIGAIFLVIPGIYLAIKYCFVFNIIADKEIGLKEAFIKSGEITKGNMMMLLGLFLVSTLIIILGVIALFVGVIPALLVTYMSYFYVYTYLIDSHPENQNPARNNDITQHAA